MIVMSLCYLLKKEAMILRNDPLFFYSKIVNVSLIST